MLDENGVARKDLRVMFIVATTQKKPTVIKSTVSWIRYVNLAKLGECEWIPTSHLDRIAAANA